ncbi:MAG: tetratricopeptide repeat protein [Pseudomonadota bacterium]
MAKARPTVEQLRLEVEAQPESSRAHLRLGTALLELSATEAEKELQHALVLDPHCVEAWVNLGGVRMARMDFKGAVEANQRALAVQPELTQARFNLGLGHLYLGQADEVVACFEQVVTREPDSAPGHYYLAVGQLAQGRVDDARASLASAMALGHKPPPEFLRALDKASGQQGAVALEIEPGPNQGPAN